MLEKLQIRNYGANAKVQIEFDPQVTTIIGKSFTGKSWILRALRWVCMNKPPGTSFINWGADRANVRLFVDNKKITRTRSKSVNRYKKTEPDYGGEICKRYTAFGNGVPPAISKVVNVSDINFQGVNELGQHEPPFWFCQTAGEVSRQLNSIVNLEIIDATLSALASKIRTANERIKVTEERFDKALEDKNALAYVKEMNDDLRRIEKVEVKRMIKAQTCEELTVILNKCVRYRKIIERTRSQQLHSRNIIEIGQKLQETQKLSESLKNDIEEIRKLRAIIKVQIPDIKSLDETYERLQEVKNEIKSLTVYIGEIKKYKELICQAVGKRKKLKLKMNLKGKCPLCGRSMVKK
jgi:DNA repair ATPase RecN